MQEVVMTGGPGEGTILFCTETERVARAFRCSDGRWYWVVQDIKDSSDDYATAVAAIQRELRVLGFYVPELQSGDSTIMSKTHRVLIFGALSLAVLGVIAMLLLATGGCDSNKMKPAPVQWQWSGYPLEVHISDKLDPVHRASALAALTWAESIVGGKRFNISIVPAATLSVLGHPGFHVIEFSELPPSKPKSDVLAETEIFPMGNQDGMSAPWMAHSAVVKSHTPSVSAYIHEVFHVLGLGHGEGTLMDVQHGRDMNGKGGDIDNMTLLPEELNPLTGF